MPLPEAKELVKKVYEMGRLSYRVESFTNGMRTYTVDMEENQGLGMCDCPDHEKNKNTNCKHIQACRAYEVQKMAYGRKPKDEEDEY